jgi:cytochrome d ubiquinol oxidase subunit II
VWRGFNPFALCIGILGLSLILLQGASWAAVKSDGDLHERSSKLRSTLAWVFLVGAVGATAATALFATKAFANIVSSPVGWVFVVLLLASLVWGRMAASGGKDLPAWYAVSLSAVSLVGLWATAIFPNLVPSLGPGRPLTVFLDSSAPLTLEVMLIIAVIGVPLVLFYMYVIYKTFAGKVNPQGDGY